MAIKNMEDLLNTNLPADVIKDIDKRITERLAAGGKEDYPYIKQQFRYADNVLKEINSLKIRN